MRTCFFLYEFHYFNIILIPFLELVCLVIIEARAMVNTCLTVGEEVAKSPVEQLLPLLRGKKRGQKKEESTRLNEESRHPGGIWLLGVLSIFHHYNTRLCKVKTWN